MSWSGYAANSPDGRGTGGGGGDWGRGRGYGRGGRGGSTDRGASSSRGRGCYNCGNTGHNAAQCPSKNRPSHFTAAPTLPSTATPAVAPQVPIRLATQNTALNPWKSPGRVSNTAHSPEQLIVQTAIDNRNDQPELLATLRGKGYQTDVAQVGTSRESTVLTNFLSIDQRPTTLFVYNVEFVREFDVKNDNKPVLIGKKFDKEGLFAALRQRPAYTRLNTQSNWVTDCNNIWSTTPLFDDLDFTVVPAGEDNLAGTNQNSKRPVTAVRATVTFNRVINLQQTVGQLYRDSNGRVKGDDDPALLQRGLNAIISKYATDAALRQGAQTLQSGANKFYNLTKSFQLDGFQHVYAYHGFFISVRPGAQQLLVNVNLRCSPFLRAGLRINDLIRSYRTAEKATSILRGVKVQLDKSEMASHQYQGIEFIANIRDPNGDFDYNVVNVGGRPPHPVNYKRSDKMRTAAMSPYRQPLSPGQTSNMIVNALRQPAQHIWELRNEAITMFGLGDPQTITRLQDFFGLVVQTDLMKLPCRLLKAPAILYKGQNADISNASWNLKGSKVRMASDGRTVQVLDMSGISAHGVAPLIDDFAEILREALRDTGVSAHVPSAQAPQTPGPYDNILEHALYTELDRLVPASERGKTSLVIVISQHSFDLYSTIKRVADLQLGIQTTCVAADKLSEPKFRSTRARMHCANICLKLNLKGDGYNHKIARANIRELYGPVSDNSTLDKANCDTIVIGADVTHPLGHCAPSCPSVAAVVGSVDDDFAKFPGSMRLQRSKQEVIAELPDMVMERLLDWADNHNGDLPGSMLFYRDGVSESQFDSVRQHEIAAIQEAYDKADGLIRRQQKLEQRKGDCPFKLTFVVVGKRHNTRFFPDDERDHLSATNGNVIPGMVVDQVITHPYITDFYLQSHQPIKGTGRSAHYFVLQNNMALSAGRLQEITHAFCYNYARATKGVSYCGPAYYADRLCDRGRAYIRDWLIGRDPNVHTPSRAQNNTEVTDQYRDFVANELHNNAWYRLDQTSPKYGRPRKNPWHPNLDNVMFYL